MNPFGRFLDLTAMATQCLPLAPNPTTTPPAARAVIRSFRAAESSPPHLDAVQRPRRGDRHATHGGRGEHGERACGLFRRGRAERGGPVRMTGVRDREYDILTGMWFPELVPAMVGAGYARITSGRVLISKHATAGRGGRGAAQVWDYVAQAASFSSAPPLPTQFPAPPLGSVLPCAQRRDTRPPRPSSHSRLSPPMCGTGAQVGRGRSRGAGERTIACSERYCEHGERAKAARGRAPGAAGCGADAPPEALVWDMGRQSRSAGAQAVAHCEHGLCARRAKPARVEAHTGGAASLKPIGNAHARGSAAPPPRCTSTTNSARRRRSRSVMVALIEPDDMVFWSTPAWPLPGVVHKNIGDR
ncbi:hypothetical protein DFH08DRAFT_808375 [Mycena albidolilacea]|uniref:Uncharacterized protein n=1 Tax=Mycena albidolilacea TaxID=1033008 RepID=A0AAD7A3C5_9AGAR|nr:hypothetical protein DFH08DRAFT_808375 [Mycena albidolilacea]